MFARKLGSSRKRTFSIECLENRQLMAGDVAATMSGGNLFLNEAAGQAGTAQQVAVSQLANGKVRVAAASGAETLINGAPFQDFTVPGSLYANFGAGNDLVVFSEAAPPNLNEIHLNVGVPNAPTGTDDDNVILWSVKSRGSVFIDTGADDDWAFIARAKIGDGIGVDNLYVNMGAGADSTTIKNSPLLGDLGGSVDIQTYGLENEMENDTVWLEKVCIKNDLAVRTGAGNDLIHLGLTTIYDDFDLNAGAGDDTAELGENSNVVDSFMARMGEGMDTMKLVNFYAQNANVMGENGYDSLTKTGGNINNFTKSGWERFNGRPTWMDEITTPVKGGVLTRR